MKMKVKAFVRMVTLLGLVAVVVLAVCSPSSAQAEAPAAADASGFIVKTAAQAIDQVVMANRILANEGVLDALGHVSLRNPENPKTFFISRALAPIEVTRKDIIEVDLDGNVVSKPVQRPYGETSIHAAILKVRPEINCVFHGHSGSLIPFTVTDIPMRPVLNLAGFIYQGVPVFDDYTPGTGYLISTKADGERVAKHLGQYRVQLLRGHGVNIVAETLPKLVGSAIYLNINAQIQLQTLALGKEPRYLSTADAKEGGEVALFKDSPMSRFWGHWTAKVRYAMPDMK
jgi:3-hydroxy-2-methylpyridine-4,5-dicarboxylate 4-decarboxylase